MRSAQVPFSGPRPFSERLLNDDGFAMVSTAATTADKAQRALPICCLGRAERSVAPFASTLLRVVCVVFAVAPRRRSGSSAGSIRESGSRYRDPSNRTSPARPSPETVHAKRLSLLSAAALPSSIKTLHVCLPRHPEVAPRPLHDLPPAPEPTPRQQQPQQQPPWPPRVCNKWRLC